MSVQYKTKKGKVITLLNPSEKGKKYATELKTGVRVTNDGLIKSPSELNDEQRAFRGGYLQAQKDSANAYKARQKKLKNKPSTIAGGFALSGFWEVYALRPNVLPCPRAFAVASLFGGWWP